MTTTHYILGVNAYHGDSAACLLADGRLVAAAEEERFRRIKHWAGLPSEAIGYCLAEAGMRLEDVADMAINSQPRAHLSKKLRYAISGAASMALIAEKVRTRSQRASVEERLSELFPQSEFQGE